MPARATYDAAKHTLEATQAALDAATARFAKSAAAAERRAQADANFYGHSVSWRADEDLIRAAKKALAPAEAARKACLVAFDAPRAAAMINAIAAEVALDAAESAECIVAKVVGITPNDRYLDPGAAAKTVAYYYAVTAGADRAEANALHSAARARGCISAVTIGALSTTATAVAPLSVWLNPLIGAGLAFAATVVTTAAHSAAATDVHDARYDARVSGAFGRRHFQTC
ncbi:hypothetical protein AGMMS49592_3480 [Endomicrobiia bacterium]|nr:hypothetical protein AGMMS49592_3480 [Endomicrobiia bacterium]